MLAPILIREEVVLVDFPVVKTTLTTIWKRKRAPLSDTDLLRHELGIHEECGNPMYFFRPGETHAIIACIHCEIRIVIPGTIRTYGELRSHFASSEEKP